VAAAGGVEPLRIVHDAASQRWPSSSDFALELDGAQANGGCLDGGGADVARDAGPATPAVGEWGNGMHASIADWALLDSDALADDKWFR
jgi:hypothetical protein